MSNAPPYTLPSKNTPDRELTDGDILFIRDVQLKGEPVGSHYFLVTEFYEPFDEDDPGLIHKGDAYNTECLLMGSVKNTPGFDKRKLDYSDANVRVPSKNTVWYADAKMNDDNRHKDSLIQADKKFLFDIHSMNYKHCGELLSKFTFDKSITNTVIPDDHKPAFKKHVENSELRYDQVRKVLQENETTQKAIDSGKMFSQQKEPCFSLVPENLPAVKQREQQRQQERKARKEKSITTIARLKANQDALERDKPTTGNPNGNYG